MKQSSPFDFFLFLYFFTLHADKLHVTLGSFNVRLNNLIALIVFTLFFIRYRSRLFRLNRTLISALLLLTLSITVSLLLSPYQGRCAYFLIWYIFTILMYVLLPYMLILEYDKEKVVSLYLISFLATGCYALFQLLFSLFGIQDPFAEQFIFGSIVRPNAFSYEPSYYALYMTPFIVMVNTHFLAARDEPFFFFKKLTYPKILFFNFFYFASTSTSTFFAFLIFCVCILFVPQVRQRLPKFGALFVLLFALLSLISPFLIKVFFLKFFFTGLSHGSFLERWTGIENAIKVFLDHPFFGVGLGAYPSYLYDAFLSGDTRFVYTYGTGMVDASNPLKLLEPTNVFTEILASLGIVGAFCFLFFVAVFVRKALRLCKENPALGYNVLVSVLVMLIVLQFNQSVLRTYVWTHLALAFALVEKSLIQDIPQHAGVVG